MFIIEEIKLLVPPYLHDLGYLENPIIMKLAEKCFEEGRYHPYWVDVRAMLEYVSCLELAHYNIQEFPKGKMLLTKDVSVESIYHTASIVFFSKALLDNLAMFLDDKYQMGIRNGGKALDKPEFKKKILKNNKGISQVLLQNKEYLDKLTSYRNNWIHRLVGGAFIGGSSASRKDGTFSDAELLIPLDPGFNMYSGDNTEVIENIKGKNDGKYLITAREFTSEIHANTLKIFFEVLDMSLELFD